MSREVPTIHLQRSSEQMRDGVCFCVAQSVGEMNESCIESWSACRDNMQADNQIIGSRRRGGPVVKKHFWLLLILLLASTRPPRSASGHTNTHFLTHRLHHTAYSNRLQYYNYMAIAFMLYAGPRPTIYTSSSTLYHPPNSGFIVHAATRRHYLHVGLGRASLLPSWKERGTMSSILAGHGKPDR